MSSETRPQAPILVFDIETVPDIELMFVHYEPELDFVVQQDRMWQERRILQAIKIQKNVDFPPPLFHTVICICGVYLDPDTYKIMDGFKRTIPLPSTRDELMVREKELLRDFWQFSVKYQDHKRIWYDALQSDRRLNDYMLRKLKPLPVTFSGYNISNFDLPVIEQRSLKHLLTCPIADYAKEIGVDSYRYKFALDKCFDLMLYVSNHVTGNKTALNTLAVSMGLGGKMEGIGGAQICERYFEGQNLQDIEDYCSVDVLITYGVLLAIQKFRGVIDPEHFAECTAALEKFLLQEGKPLAYKKLAQMSQKFFRGDGVLI